MGNKIDMRDAVSEDELRIAMGLVHTTGKQVRSHSQSTVSQHIGHLTHNCGRSPEGKRYQT